MNLADKVILLVGGLGDLATSIALRLAHDGASLVIAGADAERGQALLEQVEATGGEVAFTAAKPDSESEAQSMIADAIMTFGSIDGLVTFAGHPVAGAASDIECDDWQKFVDRDLKATWLASKFAMPFLRRSMHGSVVCLMTQEARGAQPNSTLESVTQAGLHGLCRSLAVDYGPAGIRVNGIMVGPLEDEAFAARLAQEKDQQSALAKVTSTLPLGRVGAPKEVAPAVSFLLSADASWISGSIIHVDGGASATSGNFYL